MFLSHGISCRKSYDYNEANQLIFNLKKPLDVNNQNYKVTAIQNIGNMCKEVFKGTKSKTIIIPIPPSKTKNDKLYDNRLSQILEIATKDSNNIAYDDSILTQKENYGASHENNEERISVDKLEKIYQIDLTTLDSETTGIIIFDDIITAGTHFRAVHNKLSAEIENNSCFNSRVKIKGFFIARTIHLPEFS